jgi:hypothetical protein
MQGFHKVKNPAQLKITPLAALILRPTRQVHELIAMEFAAVGHSNIFPPWQLHKCQGKLEYCGNDFYGHQRTYVHLTFRRTSKIWIPKYLI